MTGCHTSKKWAYTREK